MPASTTMELLSELRWRGLLKDSTGEGPLAAHLSSGPRAAGRRVYCGFDPTADSLTIGNLVPIMVLRHVQRAGHTPIVVMGGGTGLIGDPSGKSEERQLLTEERVRANVESQRRIFEGLLAFEGPCAASIANNADWLTKVGYVEMLRDVGKHFSVNMMIQKDSVRERLHQREQGISYTEFSYMILQAYDFLRLFDDRGVTVQCGGSDQFGNIVAGVDLIRRARGGEAHAFTAPLVTKADGTKFGKTESGAVWLTRERTSPYAYYQFWLNASDGDVGRFLRIFTLLTREEIEAAEAAHAEDPGKREAQRLLAREATALLHGGEEMERAQAAAGALFSGDVKHLDASTLRDLFAETPSSEHPRALLSGEGVALVDALPETSLCKSKREAREHLGAGAVSVNGEKAATDARLTERDLLHGATVLLRRGKKHWHVMRWV